LGLPFPILEEIQKAISVSSIKSFEEQKVKNVKKDIGKERRGGRGGAQSEHGGQHRARPETRLCCRPCEGAVLSGRKKQRWQRGAPRQVGPGKSACQGRAGAQSRLPWGLAQTPELEKAVHRQR
ncbi:hypothetical protein U0070_025327, partial [Myodes glareolus]